MDIDIESLNREYFGFLDDEYGLEYGNSAFFNQNVIITIQVSGFTAGVSSSVEVYIWFKQEPVCTRMSFEWIAVCLDTELGLDDKASSLLENYQKLSSSFRNHAAKVLYQHDEWLLPSMKIHFNWMFNRLFRGNLGPMLAGPRISDMYNYIKDKDPGWNPS